jgi:hypothetical protein
MIITLGYCFPDIEFLLLFFEVQLERITANIKGTVERCFISIIAKKHEKYIYLPHTANKILPFY